MSSLPSNEPDGPIAVGGLSSGGVGSVGGSQADYELALDGAVEDEMMEVDNRLLPPRPQSARGSENEPPSKRRDPHRRAVSISDMIFPMDESARNRMRQGRTNSLLINELMTNTTLQEEIAQDAAPEEILEKAFLMERDRVAQEVTERERENKDTIGQMHEQQLDDLKKKMRRQTEIHQLQTDGMLRDHKMALAEQAAKFRKEGGPRLQAQQREFEREKQNWLTEREELEEAIKELNESHSDEFVVLQQDKRDHELRIEKLEKELSEVQGTGTKREQQVIVVTTGSGSAPKQETEQFESLQGRLRRTEKRLTQTEEELKATLEQSQQAEQELQRMAKDHDRGNQTASMLKMEIHNFEEKLGKVQGELAESQAAVEQLRADLDESRLREADLSQQLDMTREQVAMLEWRQRGDQPDETPRSTGSHSRRDSNYSDGYTPVGDDGPQPLIFEPIGDGGGQSDYESPKRRANYSSPRRLATDRSDASLSKPSDYSPPQSPPFRARTDLEFGLVALDFSPTPPAARSPGRDASPVPSNSGGGGVGRLAELEEKLDSAQSEIENLQDELSVAITQADYDKLQQRNAELNQTISSQRETIDGYKANMGILSPSKPAQANLSEIGQRTSTVWDNAHFTSGDLAPSPQPSNHSTIPEENESYHSSEPTPKRGPLGSTPGGGTDEHGRRPTLTEPPDPGALEALAEDHSRELEKLKRKASEDLETLRTEHEQEMADRVLEVEAARRLAICLSDEINRLRSRFFDQPPTSGGSAARRPSQAGSGRPPPPAEPAPQSSDSGGTGSGGRGGSVLSFFGRSAGA